MLAVLGSHRMRALHRLHPKLEIGMVLVQRFIPVIRGDARAESDVDILVHFIRGAYKFARFLALSELLQARLGRHVDLVTTEALSPFIGPHILAEAQDVLRAA